MIVTAALPWWNERPEDLDACVRGMANIADRVVALDGAYARYPGATPRSSTDQVEAIREAAASVNLECSVIQPDLLWSGQVAKRSALLAIASDGSDWIVTVDADHIIHAERFKARHELKRCHCDVLSVPYVTPINPKRSLAKSAVGDWHIDQTAERVMIPHIWRVYPGFRVERFHWWYSAIKDGQPVWLWGGDGRHPSIPAYPIDAGYEVEHRTLFRTPDQIKASRAFLNDRIWIVEHTGQEDDRPDLRRPEYDYRHVPA